MMTDFDYEVPVAKLTEFMRRPMVRSTARGDYTATIQLELFARLGTIDDGRLKLTSTTLHNAKIGETAKPAQKWIAGFDAPLPGNPDGFLIIYRDLSCLICIQDETLSARHGTQWLEILPMVFQIPKKNQDRVFEEEMEFRGSATPQGNVELTLVSGKATAPLFSQTARTMPAVHSLSVESACHALQQNAAEWSRAFLGMPYLHKPAPGESRKGFFGLTTPAPHPELEGRPYSWPANIDWSGTTDDAKAELKEHLRLAMVYLMTKYPQHITALQAHVFAGRPTKPRIKPKVTLRAELARVATDAKSDIDGYTAELEDLLIGPNAPFDYRECEGSEVVIKKTKSGQKIMSQPETLARVTLIEPPSAHEHIEATAYFRQGADN